MISRHNADISLISKILDQAFIDNKIHEDKLIEVEDRIRIYIQLISEESFVKLETYIGLGDDFVLDPETDYYVEALLNRYYLMVKTQYEREDNSFYLSMEIWIRDGITHKNLISAIRNFESIAEDFGFNGEAKIKQALESLE